MVVHQLSKQQENSVSLILHQRQTRVTQTRYRSSVDAIPRRTKGVAATPTPALLRAKKVPAPKD